MAGTGRLAYPQHWPNKFVYDLPGYRHEELPRLDPRVLTTSIIDDSVDFRPLLGLEN